MPQSEHIHKSMLLRGVKFSTPKLDRSDIDGVRNRSARGGRSYGGAPLHMDNYRPRYNNNNGYRGNNHHHNGYNRSNGRPPYANKSLNPENPFAAHLNPNVWSNNSNNNNSLPPPPPPPQMAAAWGMQPPPYSGGNPSYGFSHGKNDTGGMNQYWQAAPHNNSRNSTGYGGRGGQGRGQGSYGYGRGGNTYNGDRNYNGYSGRSRGGASYER